MRSLLLIQIRFSILKQKFWTMNVKKKGYKRLYTPEIKVLHHQNVATNQVYSNLVEKTIFSNKCNFESTSYFLELMGKEK